MNSGGNMILQNFAAELEEYRLDHGLTKAELAEILDVPRPTLSHWILGDSAPRYETLLKIEKLLGDKYEYCRYFGKL